MRQPRELGRLHAALDAVLGEMVRVPAAAEVHVDLDDGGEGGKECLSVEDRGLLARRPGEGLERNWDVGWTHSGKEHPVVVPTEFLQVQAGPEASDLEECGGTGKGPQSGGYDGAAVNIRLEDGGASGRHCLGSKISLCGAMEVVSQRRDDEQTDSGTATSYREP